MDLCRGFLQLNGEGKMFEFTRHVFEMCHIKKIWVN